MKSFLTLIAFLVVSVISNAQNVTFSEVNLKSTETGKGKLRKAPKKIYIAEFRVFYQIVYTASETEKGKLAGNMLTGSATASLMMNLSGLVDEDLIGNTNYLYNQTITRMKEAGYEIVTPDQIAGIKEFKGWQRKKGGTLNDAQAKGFLMSTPTDFEYFVKGTKESGKEKSTFTDNSAKISFQGDNVTVVKINLIVPMAENGESYISSALDIGAKAVGQTAFKISDEGVGGTFTTCSFINSEAMSLPTSMMVYNLKDPIEIEGVLEKQKVKVVGVQDISFGIDIGLFRHFEVENTITRKSVPIPVESALYNKGVRDAGDAFIKKCWEDFYSSAK
jgi:hypothetical protein